MGETLGHECVMTVTVGQTTTEIDIARDGELNRSASEIDATSRANEGWKKKRAGLKEWGYTVEVIHDPTNAGYQALESAFDAGTPIKCKFVDADGYGIEGDMYVTDFGQPEKMDDEVVNKVTLVGAGKPTAVAP